MSKNGPLPKLEYGEVSLMHDISEQAIRFAQCYHEIKKQRPKSESKIESQQKWRNKK